MQCHHISEVWMTVDKWGWRGNLNCCRTWEQLCSCQSGTVSHILFLLHPTEFSNYELCEFVLLFLLLLVINCYLCELWLKNNKNHDILRVQEYFLWNIITINKRNEHSILNLEFVLFHLMCKDAAKQPSSTNLCGRKLFAQLKTTFVFF